MSCRLIYGHDKAIARWVADRLGLIEWLGDTAAIGVVKDDQLVAGVVYYAYRHPNVEMAVASIDPMWLNRKILHSVFWYPFEHLKCRRVSAIVDVGNHHARKFDEKLGFIQEAILKDANPNGDAVLYRMLKHECRWINGQQRRKHKNLHTKCGRNSRRANAG